MKKSARWAVLILGFVWMAFVYASFYLVQQQRPFDVVHLRAFTSTLLDLLAAGAISLAGTGLGLRFCRWLGVSTAHVGERLVLSCGLGLGAFAFLVLGIGLSGWLAGWIVAALLGGLALLSLPDLADAARRLLIRPWEMARPRRGMGLYLVGTLLLTLLVALTPPLDWDGLFYHLTMPRLYIAQGRIAPVTDVPHQHFPGLMEMLYLAAMLLKGEVAAKLLHLGYMLLLAGAIYLVAQRHIGPGYGWPAVVVYAAMPMVPVLGSWAYNDLALGFYQIVALYALLNWLQEKRFSWLILSALYCGLAMGLKYTGFVCPLALVFLICWRLVRTRARWNVWGRTLLLFCGIALLVASPWYLRNWAFTGNPVYPFAYCLFGGQDWDGWRAAWYARAGSGLGWDWAEWIKLPWTLTLGFRDMNFYDGRTGPLFLLALPFLLAWGLGFLGSRKSRPPAVGYLLIFSLFQYAFWTVGVIRSRSLFQSRLLLTALAALCAPLALLFGRLRALDTRLFSLRRLVAMSVVLVLAANFCDQFLNVVRINPLPVLVGEESRSAFLTRNLGAHYAAMELVNERVPEGGQVLFLWEPRSYYCLRAAQPDSILERWAWLRHQHDGDLDAIARALRDKGYTHLLLHRAGLDFMRQTRLDPLGDADLAAWDAFVDAYLKEEAGVGTAYQLYCLADPSQRAPSDPESR
jgi:hypothetical protein